MGGGAGSSEISTTRTSKTGWLKDSDHPTVASLTRRISLVTGLAERRLRTSDGLSEV